LRDPESPKGALSASIGLHGTLLVVLLLIPLVAPQTLRLNYDATMLAPPEPPRADTKVEEKLVLEPLPIPKPPKSIVEPVPVREPEVVTPRLPEVRITEARPALVIPPPPRVTPLPPPPPVPLGEAKALPAPAPPVVVTNVFSTVASPTVTAPVARTTEASGFGDAETRTSRAQTRVGRPDGIGTLTGFDASGVPGGRGAAGRSGSVASTLSGFDAGGVPGGRGTAGRGGSVMASGFSDTATLPKSAAPAPKAPATGIEKPVEITFKPRPEYTDDARKMRIEGEVLVRVTFTQSGTVRVLDVIRGLGYGLDENAVRAAEQIKFKPAQRAGQPVDSTAVVHIVFQLAY